MKRREQTETLRIEKGRYEPDTTPEEAITIQTTRTVEAFVEEFARRRRRRVFDGIRAVARVEMGGAVFVLDMRVVYDDERDGDELLELVDRHLLEMGEDAIERLEIFREPELCRVCGQEEAGCTCDVYEDVEASIEKEVPR